MAKLIRAGMVIDIDGPRLMVRHPDSRTGDHWFQAHVGMGFYLNDEFRTDRKTRATLEFNIGGKVRVPPMRYEPRVKKTQSKPSIYPDRNSPLYRGAADKASYLKIINLGQAKIFDPFGMHINLAKMYSKFDKQEDEMWIYSSGGLLGGTEG